MQVFNHNIPKNWISEAEKMLEEWQKRLRLRDWDVSLSFVSTEEIEDSNKLGEVSYSINSRTAHITLLNPENYDEEDTIDAERVFEDTIVHELLHLHLAPIFGVTEEDAPHQMIFEEQAIESISGALMAIKYNPNKLHRAQKGNSSRARNK